MPDLLSYLQRLRQRQQTPGMMSDQNGITGNGPLSSTDDPGDSYTQQSPIKLPPRPNLSGASDSQSSSQVPPSAFAGAGVTQGEHDPTINRIAQEGLNAPPTPGTAPAWRSILAATAAGLGGRTGQAFAPLIKYGNKGAQQEADYQKWQAELPNRIKIGDLVNADTNAQANTGYKNAALANTAQNQQRLDLDRQVAQQGKNATEEDAFTRGGGQYQSTDKLGGNMDVPSQSVDTTPPMLPPKVQLGGSTTGPNLPKSFLPPSQFRPQMPVPPQVSTPQSMQLPGGSVAAQPGQIATPPGYNKVPTPAYAAQNGQRIVPTKAQLTKENQDAINTIPIGDEMASELKIPKGTKVSEAVYPHLASSYLKTLEVKSPTEVGLALKATVDKDHPQGDPVKALGLIRAQKIAEHPGASNVGTLQIQEDAEGNPVTFNTKTGDISPATGVQKSGTKGKADAAAAKINDPIQHAVNYANDYGGRSLHTGPGDEALMEQFFEVTKPSTGFRMSQPQIDMLKNAQSWMGSASAKIRHATSGTWFSDEQRNQIVGTMKDMAKAKGIKLADSASPVTVTPNSRPPLSSFGN